MDYKKIIFPAFIILVLAQLFVPASMILKQEDTIKTGKVFKFRTAPIDPYDPFRGKYVRLTFKDNEIGIDDREEWTSVEQVYVKITENKEGYAIIESISQEQPDKGSDFLSVKVSRIQEKTLYVNYPFSRFYMEESKAFEAETIYREARRDTNQIAYALVKIKNGNAVLENVMINDVPLKEVVEKNRLSKEKE